MSWETLLPPVFEVCLIPLLGALTAYLIAFIRMKIKRLQEKTNNDTINKYLDMLEKTVTACVLATKQTYVDSLKNSNSFNREAQEQAFNQTYQAIINILSQDAKEYLTAAYGDLEQLIVQKIEAQVNIQK